MWVVSLHSCSPLIKSCSSSLSGCVDLWWRIVRLKGGCGGFNVLTVVAWCCVEHLLVPGCVLIVCLLWTKLQLHYVDSSTSLIYNTTCCVGDVSASGLLPTATGRVAAFRRTTNIHTWCARAHSLYQRSLFSAEQSESLSWMDWIDEHLQAPDRWAVSFRYTGER